MARLYCFLYVLICYTINVKCQHLPEIGMNATQLIEYRGYPAEIHEVTTSDGYILELHRIPHGRGNERHSNKPAILLVPGFLCSSMAYLINPREKGLPYILADLDYDVWVGNTRGSVYAQKHKKLNPDEDQSKFWDFSMHEMGYYDLPSTIDYILNKTNQDKLYYVGHSQGTSDFMVMASTRPEYNEKIALSILLAPVVYMDSISSSFAQIGGKMQTMLRATFSAVGKYKLLPNTEFLNAMGSAVCMKESPLKEACKTFILLLCGWDSVQLNETMLPLIASTQPAGSSVKELLHLFQLIDSGKFRQFDFGLVKNLLNYGHMSPPQYDISQVTAPVALYYGENDRLSSVEGAKHLERKLPRVVHSYAVPFKKWNHLDFLWAKQINEYLHDDVIKQLRIH